MLNDKKLLSLISIARKANMSVDGETLVKAISKNKVKVVFLANDAAKNTNKKIRDKCAFYQVYLNDAYDSETLSQCIGKSNRMAVGIVDAQLGSQMIKIIEGGGINGRFKKEEKKTNEE